MKVLIKNQLKYFLFTCQHVISKEDINSKITINLFCGKKNNEQKIVFKLDKEERFIISFEDDKDATIIEILESDNISEDKYLLADLSYKYGYDIYKNGKFLLAGYPADNIYEKERHISSGKIMSINRYEFRHTLDTRQGSSGAPICLFENVQVIGMHKSGDRIKPINYGTFIGIIIDELEKEYKQIKKDLYDKNIKKVNDPIYDIINEKIREYLSDYLTKIKVICIQNNSKVLPPTFAKSSKNLVLNLTQNENGYSVYKSKILNVLNKITYQPDYLKINFLNVMVFGKIGVGKSTLINSILKLQGSARANENMACIMDIAPYTSKKIPFLQLIDTRGLEKIFIIKVIQNKSLQYISELAKANDINKRVHCIWFCIEGRRFEKWERDFIEFCYNKFSIPIIIVNTKAVDKVVVEEFKDFFQRNKIGNDFVGVLARERKFGGNTLRSYGLGELLGKTIKQCRLTLKALYEEKICKSVCDNITEENSISKKKIQEDILKECNNNFIQEDYHNYLIKMYNHIFSINLRYYFRKNLSSGSIELLKNSDLIKDSIKNFNSYKNIIEQIIAKDLNNISIDCLNIQSMIERNHNQSILVQNRRNLNDFMNLNKKFLGDHLINITKTILLEIYSKIINDSFESELNNLTNKILNDSNTKEIIYELIDKKYEEFESKINYDIYKEQNNNINI